MYLALLGVVSIFSGQVVQLSVPTSTNLQAAVVSWNDQIIPYDCVENYCYTIIGVDLDTAPGDYTAESTMFFSDGGERRITHTIKVETHLLLRQIFYKLNLTVFNCFREMCQVK